MRAKLRSLAKSKAAPSEGKLALPFAKKKKPEAMASVEGAPAKMRLDRPSRKVGGRVKRDSGGPVEGVDKQNPLEDQEAAHLRDATLQDWLAKHPQASDAALQAVRDRLPLPSRKSGGKVKR